MSYNITSETEVLNKKPSKEGSALLNDPAYREQFMARWEEALRKNMDMVHFWKGEIKLIENKPIVRSYAWNSKKREFEREKQQVVAKDEGQA